MITETFEYPFDFFLTFMTMGLVFSMFVYFAVVLVANLKIVSYFSRLFEG